MAMMRAVAVLSEKAPAVIGHEHRILSIVRVFEVLLTSVDQRHLVPLIVAKMQFAIGLISVLIAVE